MTNRPTCKTCRFWAAPDRETYYRADCRIRAPLFVAGYSCAVWPASAPDDWCGEHALEAPAPPPWACPADGCAEPRWHWHQVQADGHVVMRFDDASPRISTPRVPPCGLAGCSIAAVHIHPEYGGPDSSVGT